MRTWTAGSDCLLSVNRVTHASFVDLRVPFILKFCACKMGTKQNIMFTVELGLENKDIRAKTVGPEKNTSTAKGQRLEHLNTK